MNSKPIISIEGIGKKYSIGSKEPYISLRDSIGQIFTKKSPGEEFWALQDVSFDVAPGESIGIVGRNGAGKSTLLKILSQITPPTTGKITLRGRVASLLEVGTGFHPELTGRENIFLNGAILGMSRVEIRKKFDEIVDFAGIEKFLDTPVKRYSSGMYVRLAFAVAAHLEPEVLIVDEVLAVGDAEFQKKCLGKMEQVTKRDGRTILFVSHNLLTVQELCKRAVLLDHGSVKLVGETDTVIETYLHDRAKGGASYADLSNRHDVGEVRFTDVEVSNGKDANGISSGDNLKLRLGYSSDYKGPISDVRVVITITSQRSEQVVLRLDSEVTAQTIGSKIKPKGQILCETGPISLTEGSYLVDIDFLLQGTSCDLVKRAAEFEVGTDLKRLGYRIPQDLSLSDYVIPYSFKEEE